MIRRKLEDQALDRWARLDDASTARLRPSVVLQAQGQAKEVHKCAPAGRITLRKALSTALLAFANAQASWVAAAASWLHSA